MSSPWQLKQQIRTRVAVEQGTIRRHGRQRIALIYPSPYHVAMSSLGLQTIYRRCNALDDVVCERAFLPDDVASWRKSRLPLLCYESERPAAEADMLAFSVAYELELTGVFDCLELAGMPLEHKARSARHPLVVMGGPLTFSNPLPLGPFADVVVLGEAETLVSELGALFHAIPEREALLDAVAARAGFWVPSRHGDALGPIGRTDDALLPACSQILTPHTELRSMFLVEPERGCSRGCHYCVMRRSTNGGMRLVPPARVIGLIPDHARRVGLVGAAVTDHPGLAEILRAIVDSGREVGISSLRADRLNDEIVGLLARGGYRALTFASDGASERLREQIERKTRERHLVRATELAHAHDMAHAKIYQMVGLPGETDTDIDELIRLTRELARIHTVVLGVSPFVAKRNTPFDGAPFAGIKAIEHRLERLRQGLKGCAEVRATSARWAWVEYQLAQGGQDAGLRALEAHRAGGGFAAWKRAFADAAPRRALRVLA